MFQRHAIHCLFVAAAVLCIALPFGALAQQPPQPTPNTTAALTEIPARLRHLEGTVTVQRAAAGETEDAVINLPLGSGDRIWSSEDGRVEIMFEDGTSIWMDSRTTLDFVSLPRPQSIDGPIVRLWTGSIFLQRPKPLSGALLTLRLDTPTGAVSFDEPGLFRIDLDDDQSVWVSAYDGSAVLTAGGLAERVSAGQRTLAETGSAPARAGAFNTSEIDDFGDWRDQRMALLASTQQYVGERDYVPDSASYYAADLEPYGNWSYHPTYAAWYWKPYAAVSWSPYRDGRWVYTYAGWSWVPSTSWGYVTTHYGRWQHGSGGWMWFPGSVWTPASVQWYVGGGHVGWVPLNYYGRPAVSFGAYYGGVGISVGLSWGGYYGWPYYGYGYSYYGYGYPYYGYGGYAPYYGRGGGWGHRYPVHYGSGRRQAYAIGPIGSASGTGRVVKGRGYSSGLADAWTVVPADEFSSRNVGRTAVARSALPRDLEQQSKAVVSGNLRARQPSTLVPSDGRSARPTTAQAGRRAVPSSGVSSPVRTTTNRPTTVSGAQRRTATARNPSALSGATRLPSATTPGAVRKTTSSSAASVRSTPARTSPSGAVRRALPRTGSIAPRSTTPSVSSAARQTMSRGNTRSTVRTPSSVRSSPTVRSSSPTVRSARPSRSASSPQRSPAVRSTPSAQRYPSVRSTPSAQRYPSVRSTPSAQRYPSVRSAPSSLRSPSVRPASPSRPGGSVRSARPGGGVRSARPSGGVRSAAPSRPGGTGVRAAPRAGSGARAPARAAKPRGGRGKSS